MNTMNTQKKSDCESALSRLRTSLKEAILKEKVKMTFAESSAKGYYAEMRVHFSGLYFDMTIANTFVCYHNPFVDGMFDKEEDFDALTKLVKKNIKILTPEEKAKIFALQEQIDAIKKGDQA